MNMISFIIEKYETEGWQKIVYTIFFIFTQNEQSKYFLLLINSRHYSFVGFHWLNNEFSTEDRELNWKIKVVNSITLYSLCNTPSYGKNIKYYHIVANRIGYQCTVIEWRFNQSIWCVILSLQNVTQFIGLNNSWKFRNEIKVDCILIKYIVFSFSVIISFFIFEELLNDLKP